MATGIQSKSIPAATLKAFSLSPPVRAGLPIISNAQRAATVRDGSNIRAGTAKPPPDTHFDSHPSWMPRFQLLAVGPHYLYVSHIQFHRNWSAGLAGQNFDFAQQEERGSKVNARLTDSNSVASY